MSVIPKFLRFQRRRQNIFGPLSPTRAWRRRRRGALARRPDPAPLPLLLLPRARRSSRPRPAPLPLLLLLRTAGRRSSRPAELLRRLAPTAAPCPDGFYHLRRLSSKRRFAFRIAEDPEWVSGFGPPLEDGFGTKNTVQNVFLRLGHAVGDSLTTIYAAMAVHHPTTSGLVYIKCSSCAYILQHLKGKGMSITKMSHWFCALNLARLLED